MEVGTAARRALIIIAIATCFRLGLAALLPVGVDEAYSLGIARQFSLSYFDHSPLHLWWVGLWAKLWGSEDLLLLRIPFVVLGALSSWLMYRLGERLFGEPAGFWGLVVFTLAPVFGAAHLALILPDGPLIAASLGTALVVARIVFAPPAGWALGLWVLAGLLAGLALLSKYHGALLVLGLFAFLITAREGRRWLATPGPWLAAAIAGICFLPVVVWNAQHDWVSFAFQAGRGAGGAALNPLGPFESLLVQSIYLLPWVAVPLAAVLVRAVVGGPANPRRWMLACLAVLPVVTFTALTLFSRGLAHWQMPGWLFALPLLGEAIAAAGPRLRRAAAVVAVLTAVLLVALASFVSVQSRWGTLDGVMPAITKSDPTDMLVPWEQLKPVLAARGLPAGERTFIATFNWIRAGELNAVFGRDVPVLCLCSDARHFAFFNPPAEFAGWTGILIGAPNLVGNDEVRGKQFDALGPVDDVSLTRAGRVVVPLAMRVGTGFRP